MTSRILFLSAPLMALFLAITAEPLSADPKADLAWVEKRVQEWQPTASERRFDEIGWAADIREARRLAREHNRPVFLFTHDGRMNLGRC
jgi:hypothetical protein